MMVNSIPSMTKSTSLKDVSSSSSSSVYPGHIFMYSLSVFVLLGIIVIVSTILYFKSSLHRKRRKYSKPGEGNEEEERAGSNSRIVERKENSFVKLSSFPTSITPIQVNRYSSSTSSSSSSVEETDRDGGNYWRFDAGSSQRSTCKRGREETDNGSPRLTFSLRINPSDYKCDHNDRVKIHLNLLQAYNLRRSYVDPCSKTFSTLTSPGEGCIFEAEGVFARVYPSKMSESLPYSMNESKVESRDLDPNVTSGDESKIREGAVCSEGEDVIETRMVKSRRSKDVSFNELDPIQLEKYQFPVRITLYEVDRNGVRFSLGHTYIVLSHTTNLFDTTFQVRTNKLYSTIYRAKNSIKILK